MTTAYSYTRFSSGEQAKGFSKERQKEMAESLCRKEGWTLDTVLKIDDLGRSAFKGERKGLAAFLAAVESGRVAAGSVLIVEKLDRLSRADIDVAVDLWKRIVRAGITIATCEPSRTYTQADLKSPLVWVEAILYFSVANEESAKKSARTSDNHRRRFEKGLISAKCPAWLSVVDGKYVVDKVKAAAVRLIFKMAIDGVGNRVTCKRLNEKGVPNIAIGFAKSATPIWNTRYIKAVLCNRGTFGEFQHVKVHGKKRVKIGEPIKDYYPAVIDEETFYAAKAATAGRDKPKGRVGDNVSNLFTGIIFDGEDGKCSMRMVNSSQQDKAVGITRRIASYRAVEGATDYVSWPYEKFEASFLEAIGHWVRSDDLEAKPIKSRLPALHARMAEVVAKIEKLSAAMDDGDFDSGLVMLRKLDKQKKDLAAEIEAEKQTEHSTTADTTATLLSLVDRLSKTPKDKLEEVRDRLRGCILRLVERVDVWFSYVEGNRLRRTMHVLVTTAPTFWSDVRFTVETYKGVVTDSSRQYYRKNAGWKAKA